MKTIIILFLVLFYNNPCYSTINVDNIGKISNKIYADSNIKQNKTTFLMPPEVADNTETTQKNINLTMPPEVAGDFEIKKEKEENNNNNVVLQKVAENVDVVDDEVIISDEEIKKEVELIGKKVEEKNKEELQSAIQNADVTNNNVITDSVNNKETTKDVKQIGTMKDVAEDKKSQKNVIKNNVINKKAPKFIKQESIKNTVNNIQISEEVIKKENKNEITTNNHISNLNNINNNINNKIANNILPQQKTQEKKEITPINDEYYEVFDSLLFPDNIIKTIQKALALHKDKGFGNFKQPEEDVMVDGNGLEQLDEFDSEVGNIYLKAIAYISKNFWTVWINDKKVSNSNNLDEDNEYVIKKINMNEALIVLSVSKSKWNYINSAGAIGVDEYRFNDKTNKIEFEIKLHPNQTFVSSKNNVIDGKYKGEAEVLINSVDDKELDLFLNDEFNFDNL